MVLGALLAQPVADFNIFEMGAGRVLQDDAMHATLRLNVALWSTLRDIREGRLEPRAFSRSDWGAVTPGDVYALSIERLRTDNQDWSAATTAMLADASLPALTVNHPQRGTIALSPDQIGAWGRSFDSLISPSGAAQILERMAAGQAMRAAAIRVATAPSDQRPAARAAGLIETATVLSRGSAGRPGRAAQRPLPENDAMTVEALARATGIYFRSEPLRADVTPDELRQRVERQEIVGIAARDDGHGAPTLHALLPFRDPTELAREIMGRLQRGQLDHLDPMTQSRLREIVGPVDNPGARLASRLAAQGTDAKTRTQRGSLALMALLAAGTLGAGSVIAATTRGFGASISRARLAGVLGQSLTFTSAHQTITGQYDAWQYPIDLATFGALSRIAMTARGIAATVGAESSAARAVANVAAAGIMIPVGAATGTAIAAAREVADTGQVPSFDAVSRQFGDALLTGTLLHVVNLTLVRAMPSLSPNAIVVSEHRALTARARAHADEAASLLTTLEQTRAAGAALQARGLVATDPERVANLREQQALMARFVDVGLRIQNLSTAVAAFERSQMTGPASDSRRRTDRDGGSSPTSTIDVLALLTRGDTVGAAAIRLSSLDPALQRQLAPDGAVFADAARRGGPLFDAVLAMHRSAGTDFTSVITGVGRAFVDAPNQRVRFNQIASQLVASYGEGSGVAPPALQVRFEQVLLRMINFHDTAEWPRVVPALLDDAVVPIRMDDSAATVAEGLSRVNNIRRLRGVGTERNIGLVRYDIDAGDNVAPIRGELEAVSGRPRNYTSRGSTVPLVAQVEQPTLGPAAHNNPRLHDTEWTLLENLARRIPRNARGVVSLFSERPCCPSCQLVIARFQRMFPNLQLTVATGPAPG